MIVADFRIICFPFTNIKPFASKRLDIYPQKTWFNTMLNQVFSKLRTSTAISLVISKIVQYSLLYLKNLYLIVSEKIIAI